MKHRLALHVLAWGILASCPASAQTIRGKVLFGSEGVPNVALLLVEGTSGVRLVSPDRVTARTGTDGAFSIKGVDPTREWELLVWDPFVEGRLAARVGVDDLAKEIVIRLKKQLRFTKPDQYAYLRGPTVVIRWTPLSGAAKYCLTVHDSDYMEVARLGATVPMAEVTLQPAQYYELSLVAYDAAGVEIGADIVYEGTPFAVGIADPAVERALTSVTGQCKLRGEMEMAEVRIAPGKSRNRPGFPGRGSAPFVVHSGHAIRLLASYQDWYKVELTNGYKGIIGWVHAADVDCRPQ